MLKIDFTLCMKFDRRIHIFMYIYVYIYTMHIYMQICEKYQVFAVFNCRLSNIYTYIRTHTDIYAIQQQFLIFFLHTNTARLKPVKTTLKQINDHLALSYLSHSRVITCCKTSCCKIR